MAGIPPNRNPITVPPKPTMSETREPKISRLRMSRFRSSVPRRWPQPGPAFCGALKFWKVGLGSGSRLAMSASSTMKPIQPTQTQKNQPSFLLVTGFVSMTAICAETLVTGDPRVDERENEVEEEVDEDNGDGDDECDALHHQVVRLVDGGDQFEAQTVH